MIREDLLRTVRDLSARHDTKAFAELVESVHPPTWPRPWRP